MAHSTVFGERRARYAESIGKDAVAVFHSPPPSIRNGTSEYSYRQSSDLYYLSGFAEAGTTLVIRPGSEAPLVMFVPPRDPEKETWNGRRAGVEGAVATYGATLAYSNEELATRLPELLADSRDLHYSIGFDREFDQVMLDALARTRVLERKGKRSPSRIVDPRGTLHELRLRKGPDEIETLRRAAAITADAHLAAMATAQPGVFEYEIEAILNYTFRRHGGAGPGYGTIVGGGVNATILHYVENAQPLRDGDLVLVDAGCEYDYYTADVTRTFPVGGSFSAPQRQIYDIVLHTQEAAIAMARPGVTLDQIHARCVELLTQGLVELGLLEGPAEARIADESYRRYYMHRTSHWLGMDVHDVGIYHDGQGGARPLEPGMVITIEPGLYVPADDSDSETSPQAHYRGIGVRIEDDILITEGGCENLTAAIPKRVAEVEAACRATAQTGKERR